jgi:hypothetical protein
MARNYAHLKCWDKNLANVVNVLHKFIVQFIGESVFESKVEITLEISFQGL